MNKITLIGDIHGDFDTYSNIVNQNDFTIQVGDLGFDYSPLDKLDLTNHRVLLGNHDNYKNRPKHDLGEYGISELNGIKFFFVRGAWSIDFHYRTLGIDLFPNEELSVSQLNDCIDLYEQTKPDFVITHDCPSLLQNVIVSSRFKTKYRPVTQQALNTMYQLHQPKLWVFGHWHQSQDALFGSTRFICLNINETININSNLNVY